MNTNTTLHTGDDADDTGIAGFEALKAEAAASGIAQDAPLDSGRFLAALDDGPAPITLAVMREIAGGVREALGLAAAAGAGNESAILAKIVGTLQGVVEKFPSVPGQPL